MARRLSRLLCSRWSYKTKLKFIHEIEILFKKWGDKLQLNVGDSVGQINQTSSGEWKLYEDKINKITITKKYGRRYFTKSKFYPLDADDVDNNTKEMEESIGQGYILTKEVFGLNEKTKPYAERWIKWANENKDKAVGLI